MPYVKLTDVSKRLGTIIARNFADEISGQSYPLFQYQTAISRLSPQVKNGRHFDSINEIVNTIQGKLKKQYATSVLKEAIQYVLNGPRNSNINDTTQADRVRGRQRGRQRGGTSDRITPSNEATNIVKLVYVLRAENIIETTFKLSSIFNLYPLVFSHNINKTNLKNTLMKNNLFGHIGRDKFCLLNQYQKCIENITITQAQKSTIVNAAQQIYKKTAKNHTRNRNKEISPDLVFLNDNNNNIQNIKEEKEIECEPYHPFEAKDWKLLFRENSELYHKRESLSEELIELQFAEGYGADVANSDKDGDCVVSVFLGHEHDGNKFFLEKDFVLLKRDEIVSFMQNNDGLFEIKYTDAQFQKYKENGIFLDEPHIIAYHIQNKTNIVIFEFEEKYMNCSQKIYFNEEYADNDILFIEFSQRMTGHCNRIRMPEDAYQLPLNKMKDDGAMYYIPATAHQSKCDINMLKQFDMKNKIGSILFDTQNDREIISKEFGAEICQKLIEMFGIHESMKLLNKLNRKQIRCIQHKQSGEAFDYICNLYFGQ